MSILPEERNGRFFRESRAIRYRLTISAVCSKIPRSGEVKRMFHNGAVDGVARVKEFALCLAPP